MGQTSCITNLRYFLLAMEHFNNGRAVRNLIGLVTRLDEILPIGLFFSSLDIFYKSSVYTAN